MKALFIPIILILGLGVSGQTVVTARAGDTVSKVAERHGIDPVDLAKYNGLLPDSVLGAGREIKLPPVAPCELPIEKAPEVRELRLGMTEKAAAEAAGVKFETDLIDRIYLRTATQRGLELQTFDDKLYMIRTTYNVEWKGIEEFVANFAPKLGMPTTGWKVSGGGRVARLACKGFEVELMAVGDWSVMKIWDTSVPKEIARLKREYEEDKKKAIRP